MRIKQAELTLAQKTRELLAQTDEICAMDPGMCEAAAMVYIGDTYSLREDMLPADDSTRPAHRFSTGLED